MRALRDLAILDTVDEARFDELIRELSETLDAPIAYLSLIDAERQWLKAKVGPIGRQVDREHAFCNHVVLGGEPIVVADATQDERFASSPLTTDDPGLRFYAGVPISDRVTGETIGTVCIADRRARQLSARELAVLEGFARRVADEVNARPTALVAYAADDLDWVEQLIARGESLAERRILDLWSDLRVSAGEDCDWKLKDAIYRSRAIVVILSSAFLRSDFVRREAFELLLELRRAEGLELVPVLIEPCDWDRVGWLESEVPLSPGDDGVAVLPAVDRERFWTTVVTRVETALEGTTDAAPARRTAGRLPPEEEPRAPEAGPRLFLSHASEDGPAAQELAAHLRRAGLEVWLDEDDVAPGDSWMESIEKAIQTADAFAVYVGQVGVERWINQEVRLALDRSVKDPQFRVIPILGPGARPEDLPGFLAQRHWLDLRQESFDPERVRKLVGSVPARPAGPVSLLARGEAPFRGLLAFDVAHAHLFFGRDRETEELLRRLAETSFLTVIGESGSGKSSLVRAGLVPALHRGRPDVSGGWQVVAMRPGRRPFEELANALPELAGDSDPVRRLELRAGCADLLARGTDGICACVGGLLPAGRRTLLIVDQFEELFTLSDDEQERDRFIDTLIRGSDPSGDRPVSIVLTLRADFFSQCFGHPRLAELVAANQYAVRSIDRRQLADVIEKPAAMAGVRLEPGLVEAILHDLGEDAASLALLEHTLLQLWNRRTDATLTHEAYESIGRVQGALEHHAEEVYGVLDAAKQKRAKRILLHLAVPGRGDTVTRRQVARRELTPEGDAEGEAVLQHLIGQRLLTVRPRGEDTGGDDTDGDEEIEVAHEALLRGWRRFRGWMEEDREFLLWRQRTRSAYEAWVESGRDHGALLRGAPLVEASRWLELRAEDLSEDGRTFVAESMDRDRRRRRLRAAVTAAIAILAVVAATLAVFAQGQKREAAANLDVATLALREVGKIAEVSTEAKAEGPETVELKKSIAERAIGIYERVARPESFSADLLLEEAVARYRLGNILTIQRQPGASEAFERAIAELEELGRRLPDDPRYRQELANARYWKANAGRDAGQLDDALGGYELALAAQRQLLDESPPGLAPERIRFELGRTLNGLGVAHRRQRSWADARRAYEEAKTSFEHAIELSGPNPASESALGARQGLAWALTNLAELYEEWGWAEERGSGERFAAAEESSRAAISVLEELGPMRREFRLELAVTHNNLANLLMGLGRWQAAERENARAVELMEELADPLPYIRDELGAAYLSRGYLLDEGLGSRREAIGFYVRAGEIYEDLLSERPEEAPPWYRYRRALALSNLAALGDRDAGTELCRLLPELTESQRQDFAGECAN